MRPSCSPAASFATYSSATVQQDLLANFALRATQLVLLGVLPLMAQDCALSPSRAMSRSCFLAANGFVTVTPFQVNPSCKSSERSRRHLPSAAAERITASQMLS